MSFKKNGIPTAFESPFKMAATPVQKFSDSPINQPGALTADSFSCIKKENRPIRRRKQRRRFVFHVQSRLQPLSFSIQERRDGCSSRSPGIPPVLDQYPPGVLDRPQFVLVSFRFRRDRAKTKRDWPKIEIRFFARCLLSRFFLKS